MLTISDDFADNTVCVVGLGYVGLTLAVAMADVGFHVEGVEIRQDVVDRLNRGDAHFFEPGLNARLKRLITTGRLRVSREIPPTSRATVYIITVGTPLDTTGKTRTDMIVASTNAITERMKPNDMIIMRSTVRLGTTRKTVMPMLDATGISYDIAFCPERTVEGQALSELRILPQIIGANSNAASVRAARLFNALTPTIVKVPSIEVAEMVKLIDNTYRDITFGFANEVARLCDSVGISAHDVITAGKLGYPRTSVPLPGPVGGPCLGKDTHILAEGVQATGIIPEIALKARLLNEGQPADLISRIKSLVDKTPGWPANPNIAVLGFAFKGRPVTDDLRGTMTRQFIDELRKCFPSASFRGWDAMVAGDQIASEFNVTPGRDVANTVSAANLIVIANNHPKIQEILLDELAEVVGRPAIFYDLWNHFAARDLSLPDGVRYIGLGDGQLPLIQPSRG
jgi:UDP-N-acetyl-D-mannosaminuronic acid dehydrogenase